MDQESKTGKNADRKTLEVCMKYEHEEVQWTKLRQITKPEIEVIKGRLPNAEKEFLKFKTPFDASVSSNIAACTAVTNSSGPDELLLNLFKLCNQNGQLMALHPFYQESLTTLNRLKEDLRKAETQLSEIEKELANINSEFFQALILLRKFRQIHVKDFVELAFVQKHTTSTPIYDFPLTPRFYIKK